MKIRKKGYWILFALTAILALATLSTVLPAPEASKVSMLGYSAHCSFTPISTIILALITSMVCFIRRRFFVTYK